MKGNRRSGLRSNNQRSSKNNRANDSNNKENSSSPSASSPGSPPASSESSSVSLYLPSPGSSQSSTSSAQSDPSIHRNRSRRHEFTKEQSEIRNDEISPTFHCKCGKKYSLRKSLVGHIRKKLFKKGKIFECPHCPARYSLHRSMKLHIKKKHQVDPTYDFGCNGCGKTFRTFEELSHHRNLAGHPVVKLGKPKVGEAPPPSQPLISQFFKPNTS